jgi:hypothetical protein
MRIFNLKRVNNRINYCIITFCVIKYKHAKTRLKLKFLNDINNYISNVLA